MGGNAEQHGTRPVGIATLPSPPRTSLTSDHISTVRCMGGARAPHSCDGDGCVMNKTEGNTDIYGTNFHCGLHSVSLHTDILMWFALFWQISKPQIALICFYLLIIYLWNCFFSLLLQFLPKGCYTQGGFLQQRASDPEHLGNLGTCGW